MPRYSALCRHVAVIFAIVLALVLFAGGAPRLFAADKPAETPSQLIERLSREVLAIIADKKTSAKEKRQKVQDMAFANMDLATMSRLTLGRPWRDLSEAQRADFIKEYRTHMANTYRSMVDNYNDEQVKMAGEEKEGEGADRTVLTRVIDPHTKNEFKVNYRLRPDGDKWKIIDVTIEGVSLVANFREQFQEIMTNGGFDKLMKMLREKNAAAEKEEPKKKA